MAKHRLCGAARRWGAAALLAGTLLAPAARLRAEEPPDPAGDPAAEPEPPRRQPYEAVGPSERRGRTFDPSERRTETSEPSFGARTHDLGEHPGEPRELREVSRPPGPRVEDPAAAPKVPAPLRLRRPLGEVPSPGDPLPARLCESERDLAHARRAFTDAVRAYKKARRDEYPRGNHKALVVEQRALAERRLRRAEAAHADLLGEADEGSLEFDPADCPPGA